MTDTADGKRDFFISFNQADRAWATWIAWVLEEAGYSVFFQDWDFRGNFVEHMDEAYRKSARIIAVLSNNYFGSKFAQLELLARIAKEPAAREDRLVPVKVGPLTGGTILSLILYADFTDCEEDEAQQRLLTRVKQAVDATYRPKPPTRSSFPGCLERQVHRKPRFPEEAVSIQHTENAADSKPMNSFHGTGHMSYIFVSYGHLQKYHLRPSAPPQATDFLLIKTGQRDFSRCPYLDFGHSAFRVVQHISGSTTAVQGFAMCVSPRDIAKTPSVIDRLTDSRSCRPRIAFGFGLPLLTGSRSKMAKVELMLSRIVSVLA